MEFVGSLLKCSLRQYGRRSRMEIAKCMASLPPMRSLFMAYLHLSKNRFTCYSRWAPFETLLSKLFFAFESTEA
uniref:Uncharacterized protein n=1 Tax=Ascaris lumbricoides TaxID=6252 RepID=A0A0M3IQT9_ASCLU